MHWVDQWAILYFLIYFIYDSAQSKYTHPELSLKDHQSKCCCSHEENLQLVGIRVKETWALNREIQSTAEMKSEGTWVWYLSLPGQFNVLMELDIVWGSLLGLPFHFHASISAPSLFSAYHCLANSQSSCTPLNSGSLVREMQVTQKQCSILKFSAGFAWEGEKVLGCYTDISKRGLRLLPVQLEFCYGPSEIKITSGMHYFSSFCW